MKLREPDRHQRTWPERERTTYQALYAVDQMSDASVLAVLLRTGIGDKSAVDVARDLLMSRGSIAGAIAAAADLNDDRAARINAAHELMARLLREKMANGSALNSPSAVREYLRIRLQSLPHEVFVCIFLDAQNRVIECETLFRGTLTQTSVYPREIVKRALRHNAGAVIFAHNHPSGVAEPSHADETLTQALKQALALVDVRVLDHFIVAGSNVLGFAERGLL